MLKRYFLCILATLTLAGCTKKNNTTINNNTINTNGQPAFAIYGIHDIVVTNGFTAYVYLPLTVQYLDSAQHYVTLSLTGVPAGIQIDTNWTKSGVPTFATTITFYDTAAVAPPGNYPLTLTAVTDSGEQKSFHFNLTIKALPASVLGKYSNCRNYCDTAASYTDSVYIDPAIPNKVWFINFADYHNLVYGYITGSGTLTIPLQTAGGRTYNYAGDIDIAHHVNMSFGVSCAMDMF